jgi:DNA-directed RNA polymerase subunit RPC12/RpoP
MKRFVKKYYWITAKRSVRCRDCNRRIFWRWKHHSYSFIDYGGTWNSKGIVIGHKGAALKKSWYGCPCWFREIWEQIHIELVKVNKNWRSNTNMLRRFGYNQ